MDAARKGARRRNRINEQLENDLRLLRNFSKYMPQELKKIALRATLNLGYSENEAMKVSEGFARREINND